MKQYQVTFAPNTDIDNIQREVINARDEQDARTVYAASDCWVYEIAEVFQLPQLGVQEPPQDPRIFNRRQADGTFRDLGQFFSGMSDEEWKAEVTAQMADDADLHQTQESARV
jgi:hypothetical protein